MRIPKQGSSASVFLDAVRGIAAILVALGHARLMIIEDAGKLAHVTLPQKLFYFSTNLGSYSVMIFFILSGFLVGSSVIKNIGEGSWSWKSYTIARVSRIYVVLLPALFIGMLFDLMGSRLFADSIVYGTPHYGFMLPESISSNISLPIFLGNLLCLQEILVPTLGSNHPLWSLTNEVWYYIIFPFFAVCLLPATGRLAKAVFFAIGVAILAILPLAISSLFIVWLFGVVIALLPRVELPRLCAWSISVVLVLLLAAQSAKLVISPPFVTETVMALFIYCWITRPAVNPQPTLARIASALSSVSYTFYLVHTPFIVFAAALIIRRGPKYLPDPIGVSVVFGVFFGALAFASIVWFLFERNTPHIRRMLSNIGYSTGLKLKRAV
jgi:peptidoglycan/LPS O-acetylase OafA/YrhL